MRHPLTMESPTDCPFCKKPLLNIYQPIPKSSNALHKFCKISIDHKIQYIHAPDNKYVDVLRVWLDITDNSIINWDMDSHIVHVWWPDKESIKKHWKTGKLFKIQGQILPLPWFEPDLSDHKSLIDKVKTYIIFS